MLLANGGVGHFHTTAAENIGELVRLAAASPRTDAYNCGDPDPPVLIDILRTIAAAAAEHRFAEVLLPDPVGRGELGARQLAPAPLPHLRRPDGSDGVRDPFQPPGRSDPHRCGEAGIGCVSDEPHIAMLLGRAGLACGRP